MVNFREVNDNDILKEWLDYREQEVFGSLTEEDKKHHIYFDENFMDYLCYWNEKYYRNGFVAGVQMIVSCVE